MPILCTFAGLPPVLPLLLLLLLLLCYHLDQQSSCTALQERKLQAKLKGEAAGPKAGSPAAPADAAAASPAGSGDAGAGDSPDQAGDGAQQQQQSQQSQQSGQQQQQEGEEEASPFAAISATMGWDCFHWLTMLWILLR